MDIRIEQQFEKIFSPVDNRALCVAVDHGLMTDPGKSWLQISETVGGAIQSGVDGLLLSSGQTKRFTKKYREDSMPAIIIRTDWTNLLRLDATGDRCELLPVDRMEYRRLMNAQEAAQRYNAAAVIGFLFVDPEGKVEDITVKASQELITESHAVGMPCIIEVLPLAVENPEIDSLPLLWKGVWQALELGADAIKLPLTDDIDEFCASIHQAGRRVFVLGGSNLSNEDLFVKLMEQAIISGADGLLVGRNVSRSDDPVRLISKLCAVVHSKDLVPKRESI